MEQTVRCQTPTNLPVYHYDAAVKAAEAQHEVFWLPTEPKIEKDLHCLKTELTEAETHGVMTTLSLFTQYEQIAGNEYWGGRFKEMFPRPEFERLGLTFGNIELGVHMPFYKRIDELLGLSNEEFYSGFAEDPVLKSRINFLDSSVNNSDDLLSIGTFSMVEGAILYSSFAYLMHFQAEGKNKMTNMHSGLTFSAKDENLHSETGAWAFKLLQKEKLEAGLIDEKYVEDLKRHLVLAADKILEHETAIIERIFEKGSIKGITAKQLTNFVMHRLDLCLSNLGLDPVYKPSYNPISNWFYKMVGGDMQHDFFAKLGSAYNRNWQEAGFTWKTYADRGIKV